MAITLMAQDLVARACANTFKIFTKQLLQELCIAVVVPSATTVH